MTDTPVDNSDLPVWHAHCGCEIYIHREHGEAVEHLLRCEFHQTHQAADVMAEARAMTIARMSIAAATGVDIEQTVATITPDGNALCVSLDGKTQAVVPPITLDQYLTAHPVAVEYAKAVV